MITLDVVKNLLTMTSITTEAEIRKLEERYPFNEEELEILARCHDHVKNDADRDDFLLKLAGASPYTFYFLPGNELRNRIDWIEGHVLPAGFCSELRAAVSEDAFVDYANQGVNKSFERFLEGIADTGRRGTREALRVLYNIAGEDASALEHVDVALRLAVASDAMSAPNLDKKLLLHELKDLEPVTESLAKSLEAFMKGLRTISLKDFVEWAEGYFPMLARPLSTFVHYLLFHGEQFPKNMLIYRKPIQGHESDIFTGAKSHLIMALSFMSPYFGGKWHRLYSADMDGRSFSRMEYSILGYSGPTLLIIKTTEDHVLGAFAREQWKDTKHFYGNAECFLFQLDPFVKVHKPIGRDRNFIYLHSEEMHGFIEPRYEGLPHGIGFGGSLSKPRLFIPTTLEHCSADYLDSTFESGELLPQEALEKFEIKSFEVWAVGGEDLVSKGLSDRAEYRERHEEALSRIREIHDKKALMGDFKAGLISSHLYKHTDSVRGRHEFRVDEKHGGYKLEH